MANKRKERPSDGGTAKGTSRSLPSGKSKWIIAAIVTFVVIALVISIFTRGG
jgi:hypothetical protein